MLLSFQTLVTVVEGFQHKGYKLSPPLKQQQLPFIKKNSVSSFRDKNSHNNGSKRSHQEYRKLYTSSSSSQSPRIQPPDGVPTEKIEKSETEWKEILSEAEYYVLREEGTEPPNSSLLNDINKEKLEAGTFICTGCGSPLFTSDTKFDSGTGWPSFYQPVDATAVDLTTDYKLVLPRTECRCSCCGGHLGHVFNDGPEPTGLRYCMNGVAMKFRPEEDFPELATYVKQRQEQSAPFQPSLQQVLPGIVINGGIGILFFNSFLTRWEQLDGDIFSSPLDIFPLLPAIFYGVQAVQAIRRLL